MALKIEGKAALLLCRDVALRSKALASLKRVNIEPITLVDSQAAISGTPSAVFMPEKEQDYWRGFMRREVRGAAVLFTFSE